MPRLIIQATSFPAREVKAIILFGVREKSIYRESRPRAYIFSRSAVLTGFECINSMRGGCSFAPSFLTLESKPIRRARKDTIRRKDANTDCLISELIAQLLNQQRAFFMRDDNRFGALYL